MNFTVTFKAAKGFAVELKMREIGIKDVDTIRERLGVALPLEQIAGIIKTFRDDVIIELDEERVRETGLFDHRKSIDVIVPKGFLSQHTRESVSCSKASKTGEIWTAWLFREADEEAILEEWAAMGYPLEWPDLEEDAQAD